MTKIDANKLLKYWRSTSDYDFETAHSLKRSRRYLDEKMKFYQVANKEFAEQWFKKGLKVKRWLLKEF